MSDDVRRKFADYLEQTRGVGLNNRWLDISQHRGAPKAATFKHSESEKRDSGEPPTGYYGVYTTGEDPLVILDVDDYGDSTADTDGVAAIAMKLVRQNETFVTESPHGGEHHYYRVVTEGYSPIAGVLEQRFGTANPKASWGEVLVANKYAIGPGTTLEDCTKDHEQLDTPPCNTGEGGRYSVKNDAEIATITAEELCYVLRQDSRLDDEGHNPDQQSLDDTDNSGNDAETVRERVAVAREHDDSDIIDNVLNGRYAQAGYKSEDGSGDRSEAECALASKLAFWLGDENDVREAMNTCYDRGKWAERGESYRETVMDYADADERFDWNSDPSAAETRGNSATPKAKASTDGGAAAPQTNSPRTGPSGPLGLSPNNVMQMAFEDPDGRFDPVEDEDKSDPTVHDLRSHEAALYTWNLLEQRNDDDVIYVTDDSFRAFDGDVWVHSDDAGVRRLRDYAQRALGPAYSTRVLEQLKDWVRGEADKATDELGIEEPYTVTADGQALDLKNRETREVHRDDLAVKQLGVEYDPEAEPDAWLDFLADVVPDPDAVAKLQEYAGYTLWHHSQPYGKALFLVGPTDSGKGTFLKVIEQIIGEENVANETLKNLIESRWGKARLFGKYANIRNEVTPGELSQVQQFKELTGGGDGVTAERKGEQKFEFNVTQKFMFATNQFPDIEDADDAFYNRCLFCRFPETIPPEEQRPGLHDELLAEGPAILNWMLEGYERLQDQNQFTGERSIEDKRTVAEEMGSALERLKQDAVEITHEPTDLVHARDFHDLATAYADREGIDDSLPAWNGGAFTSAVKQWPGVGSTQSRQFDRDRVYQGMRIDKSVCENLNVEVRTGTAGNSDKQQTSLDG